MLRVKDIARVVDTNSIKIIYEDYWSGQSYDYVDKNSKVESICPVDKNTLKVGITN